MLSGCLTERNVSVMLTSSVERMTPTQPDTGSEKEHLIQIFPSLVLLTSGWVDKDVVGGSVTVVGIFS